MTDAARQRALAGLVHEGVEVAVDNISVKGGLGRMILAVNVAMMKNNVMASSTIPQLES